MPSIRLSRLPYGFCVQFPLTSLRELRVLKMLRHPNIVQIYDVAVGKERDRSVAVLIVLSLATLFHPKPSGCSTQRESRF
jgi:serine/threonine protein kinase